MATRLRVSHQSTESTATVEIRGAATARPSFRLCHLSDSHVTVDDSSHQAERQTLGLEPADAIAEAYVGVDAAGLFEGQVQDAVAAQCDALIHTCAATCHALCCRRHHQLSVLTLEHRLPRRPQLESRGDFLNVPCKESIDYVTGVLSASGLPWLFTSGNHVRTRRSQRAHSARTPGARFRGCREREGVTRRTGRTRRTGC